MVEKILSTLKTNRKDIFIAFIILIGALAIRAYNLPADGINPDEYRWHARSNRFYHVVKDGRWEDSMQAGHPGSTVTWNTVLSLRTFRRLYRQFDPTFDYQDYPHLTNTWERIHFATVFPVMFITSLFLSLFYLGLKALSNRLFALTATSLVFTDVYFLAHSRTMQMDAMQSTFIIGSLITALLFYKYKKNWLVIATGVLLGLNVMTKIYGLAVLPFLFFIMNWDYISELFKKDRWEASKKILINSTLLTGTFLVTSVLLLPAWIADFWGVIKTFERSIFAEGLEGRFEGNEFFFGKLFQNGEPRIFYLFAFIFRQSVLPFILLPISLFLITKNKLQNENIKKILLTFGLFALFWVFTLSLPSKKEDRYILASHVLIDTVAAFGLYYLIKTDKLVTKSKALLSAGILVIFTFLLSTFPLKSTYMGYYNPLLGGANSAVKYIRVGWGEGFKPIANYLNDLPDPENIKVASWYESSLSPYCECNVTPTFNWEGNDIDYLVFYVNQLQRDKEEIMIDAQFKKENVVMVNFVGNQPYTWLIKKQY